MKSQRGNVLFFILIAVALFAALSYVISRAGRGGGSPGVEREQLLSSRLLQASASLKSSAVRLVVSGVKPDDIKLHLPADSASPCTDTDGTCLFQPTGGGAVWPTFQSETYDPAIVALGFGYGSFHGVEAGDTCGGAASQCGAQFEGLGTSATDVGIGVSGIAPNICLMINKIQKKTSIPAEDADFIAALPNYITIESIPGEETGCIDISVPTGTAGLYSFFQALIIR